MRYLALSLHFSRSPEDEEESEPSHLIISH